MGSAPPTIALGLMASADRGLKDTALNILETGEFVINLVPERSVQAMNLTSADAPLGVDELQLAGLATLPSHHIAPPRIAPPRIAPPRIAGSPVAFECRALSSVVTGPCQTVVIGRVLAAQIEDRSLREPARAHIETDALDLLARSFGSEYIRSHDRFELPRPTWASLMADGKV